jgi:hypothetical protein
MERYTCPLPNIDRRDTRTDIQTAGRDDAVEIGPGVTIYIPSFIKFGSDISKVDRWMVLAVRTAVVMLVLMSVTRVAVALWG